MLYAPAFYVILFLSLLHSTDAVRLVFKHGIDVSSLVSIDSFRCLRNLKLAIGFDFLIVRGYRNVRDGETDSNVVQTLANAKEAGFKDIDVYMFPCSHKNCKKPRQQVREMVNALKNSFYKRIWLDIEGAGEGYWKEDKRANQKFFEELLSEARKYKKTGVYASQYQWNSIMGEGYTGGHLHQLWYPNYNGLSISNKLPKPFGGWKSYYMRQYAQNLKICGVTVDWNYRITTHYLTTR